MSQSPLSPESNTAPTLERFRWIILIFVVLAIVGGSVVLLTYHPAPVQITILPPPPTATSAPSATPGPVRIYVTGAVINPATLYTLPPNSRVSDAIAAAGGLADDADPSGINQAAVLHDGDQIDVPAIGTRKSSGSVNALPTAGGLVHINSASEQDLRALPGCGPSLAKTIVAYRDKNGPFKSMADLDKVPGVGPSRLQQWQSLIAFD